MRNIIKTHIEHADLKTICFFQESKPRILEHGYISIKRSYFSIFHLKYKENGALISQRFLEIATFLHKRSYSFGSSSVSSLYIVTFLEI
jgi:hypothetical protein